MNLSVLFFRCLLWDKEFASREKDSEIRELKQKIVNLSGMLKKSEAQKAELIHQVKFIVYFLFLVSDSSLSRCLFSLSS